MLAVDAERRDALRRPHTTNHLMLKAMKQVLGEHVSQAGSQLDEDEIRFDFSHFQAVTPARSCGAIEAIVNRWMLEDHPVRCDEMPLLEAKRMGVTAVFDEKYGATVRVVSVGRGEMDSWTAGSAASCAAGRTWTTPAGRAVPDRQGRVGAERHPPRVRPDGL